MAVVVPPLPPPLTKQEGQIPLRPTVRWIFAVLAIFCGVYVLAKTGGSTVLIAAGLGILFAAIEGITS